MVSSEYKVIEVLLFSAFTVKLFGYFTLNLLHVLHVLFLQQMVVLAGSVVNRPTSRSAHHHLGDSLVLLHVGRQLLLDQLGLSILLVVMLLLICGYKPNCVAFEGRLRFAYWWLLLINISWVGTARSAWFDQIVNCHGNTFLNWTTHLCNNDAVRASLWPFNNSNLLRAARRVFYRLASLFDTLW